jgi:hypothetical protein
VVQARIDRLGSGEKPVNSVMYIESTAVGVTDKDARDGLTKQLNELTDRIQRIRSEHDKGLWKGAISCSRKMNYVIPTLNELKDQFQQQA